jgi:hypothetical protein
VTLFSIYFDGGHHDGRGQWYRRMGDLLAWSAAELCPAWDRQIGPVSIAWSEASALGNLSHEWNSAKLRLWAEAIIDAPDGANVVLMDADMLIVRPLDAIWDHGFDLAYTLRLPGGSWPFNGGLVAVRVSERTRAFMRAWQALNDLFLTDKKAHEPFRAKYAGINQSAFGALLEQDTHGLKLEPLACAEWNCVEWPATYSPNTRVIHYKGPLRRALIDRTQFARHQTIQQLVKLWDKTERRMKCGGHLG